MTQATDAMRDALYFDEMEARLTAPVSERMLSLARLSPGMRVLDVATGRGEPALKAARLVGERGRVLGVDPWAERLAVTADRAAREGLRNVELLAASVEEAKLEAGSFDVALCRWGIGYVPSPPAALSVIHDALAPGGLFVAAVWAERERLSWWSVPRDAAERYATLPPVDPQKSGVFRFATLAQIDRDFTAAGFEVESVIEMDVSVVQADSGAGIVEWIRAELSGYATCVPTAQVASWEEHVTKATLAFRKGPRIELGGITRIIVARRP
jgi:ubiquinone/menaquinone biosynthesis C-methylase UbiE